MGIIMKKVKKLGLSGRRFLAGMVAAGMAVVLAGCGKSSDYAMSTASSGSTNGTAAYDTASYESSMSESYYDYDNGYVTSASESGVSPAESTSQTQVADTSRKLIKTVSMSVETKEFDTMLSSVQSKVTELGGYVESMDVYNGSSYSYYRITRDASLTVRIPQNRLDDFLNTVSDIGNVINRSDSVEDITLTYVDTQSRRDALETEQERLLVLLDKAESVEDIITIESRLSEVRYELESIESKLRTYDNQVDYSTVYLSIDEVKELTPVEEKSTLQRMTDGFVTSLKNIGTDIKELAVWFVVHIPYIIIWAAIIICAIFVLRALKKRIKRIKERKKQIKNSEITNKEITNKEITNKENTNKDNTNNETANKKANKDTPNKDNPNKDNPNNETPNNKTQETK
jgi:hypothetical protein